VLKSKKAIVIEEMSQVYVDYTCFIVARYQGLTVAQITSLRRSLKKDGANFKIVKNSLSKIAASNSNKKGFDDILFGPVGIIYANEPVSIAKKLVSFAKTTGKLQIVGGVIDNHVYTNLQIVELSKLASMEQIRGGIVGSISGVASSLIRVIQTPGAQIARVCSSYSSSRKE
jgi:large subunit ribosomal protein L10